MACLYLIFASALISLVLALGPSPSSIDCGPPKSFQVELDNDERAYVFDAELRILFDRDNLAVYEHPGLNAVNYLINGTEVYFSGHVLQGEEELEPEAHKTHTVFNSTIGGSARRKTAPGMPSPTLTDHKVFMLHNHNEGNLPKKVQVEIIHEAAACLREFIEKSLGALTPEDLQRGREVPHEFGSASVLSADPRLNAEDIKTLVAAHNGADDLSRDGLQSTINKIVDLAVEQLVQKIDEENQGKIQIPEIHQNFTTGKSFWKVTGDFDTSEGTFEDLTSLKRTEDAKLSHEGLRFTASAGFGLSTALMEYSRYKLRYGVAKVSGRLSGSVDGVAMQASVAVDYNRRPCRTELVGLRFTELGKIKIKITGLGPLNKLLSKLVSWVTKKWKDNVARKVEDRLRTIVAKNLNKLNCEKYRP